MGKIEEEGLRRFSHPVNIFIATKKIGVNVLTSAETSLIYKLINKSITYQAYRYDNKMVDRISTRYQTRYQTRYTRNSSTSLR